MRTMLPVADGHTRLSTHSRGLSHCKTGSRDRGVRTAGKTFGASNSSGSVGSRRADSNTRVLQARIRIPPVLENLLKIELTHRIRSVRNEFPNAGCIGDSDRRCNDDVSTATEKNSIVHCPAETRRFVGYGRIDSPRAVHPHPGDQSGNHSSVLCRLGTLSVTFEEGTWSAWLYDLLHLLAFISG